MSSVKNITEHKFPLYQPGKLGGSHHTVVHTISPLKSIRKGLGCTVTYTGSFACSLKVYYLLEPYFKLLYRVNVI